MVPARPEVQNSGDNDLERSIKAAMMRMKKVSADSDEEDRGDEETRSLDWENWEQARWRVDRWSCWSSDFFTVLALQLTLADLVDLSQKSSTLPLSSSTPRFKLQCDVVMTHIQLFKHRVDLGTIVQINLLTGVSLFAEIHTLQIWCWVQGTFEEQQ